MTTSFLLCQGQPNQSYQIGKDSLENIALPVALESDEKDPFGLFLKAIYEDYDLDKALGFVEEMHKFASADILLKSYAFDIKKQAYLLIF